MKVILLEDVRKVGKKGDVVNVTDGYAKHCLLPKKLAMEATNSNLNDIKLKKISDDKKRAEELEEAKKLAEKLKEKTINVFVKAGDNGKLFGSVTGKEIATSIKEQTGIDIDKKKISLAEPIKEVGEKEILVKLNQGVSTTIKVNVELGGK
ncbi:MAG: 50S ribosomal protein L9 [Firmicutes bacterium]|nr:50S ribosomal protein L9 [Bacillota bacterium]MBR2593194.1 50S ribosomal protein L9 [Bacillota bacterium]